MQMREAPDFWGLNKNMNCAFPLSYAGKTLFAREVLFLLNFGIFKLGFSKGTDSHVSLSCSFSMCAIPNLITYFELRVENLFSKNKIYLMLYSISVFKILLLIFLLIYFLLVLRNLISVKVLMVSCWQTKV